MTISGTEAKVADMLGQRHISPDSIAVGAVMLHRTQMVPRQHVARA